MQLNAQKAQIFRVTHVDNAAWDLRHGLCCRNSPALNPNFRNIGNLDLIEKRKARVVPVAPFGTLSDYVPFYFTSRSPMLYNVKTGYNGIAKVPMADIVIYISSLRRLAADGSRFVFTDRHAKLELANFFTDLASLDNVDWQILQDSNFRYDPADPGKMDRYQAEALVHRQLSCKSLTAIVCHNDARKSEIASLANRCGVDVPVIVKPGMFF